MTNARLVQYVQEKLDDLFDHIEYNFAALETETNIEKDLNSVVPGLGDQYGRWLGTFPEVD